MKSTLLNKWLCFMLWTVFLCLSSLIAYGAESGFPWSPPYTAEQIVYLSDAVKWAGGIEKAYKTIDFLALKTEVDATGYIRQSPGIRRRKNYYDNYGELLDYTSEKLKVGQPRSKLILFAIHPPTVRGKTLLTWKYKKSPDQYKAIDFWVYSPSSRTVRRMAMGDRQDGYLGGDMTYDDVLSLEPFDETHNLLGEDVLPPGGVCPPEPRKCYVVKSVNKDPNYYLSKRIRWIDKENFIPWMEEQYDKTGFLRVIFERKMEKIQGYIVATQWNYWNIQRNYRQSMFLFDYQFDQPISDAQFNPDYLRKEYAWRSPSLKQYPLINGPDELPPRPPLLRDRFPEERKIKE